VVARNLLLVSVSVYRAPPNAIRKSVETMPLADPIDGRVGRLDAVIALQIPDDSYRAHVIRAPEVQDLLDDLFRGLVGVP
jgi:hypothetical protein